MPRKMIDVSSNNHPGEKKIDWDAVKKDGYDAVMIKATEGMSYTNPWLQWDAEGAVKAGLMIGYYHFGQPGEKRAIDQADFCWQTIKDLPRNLGIALDLEVANGRPWFWLSGYARNFLKRMHSHAKYASLYTNPYWLGHLRGAPWGYPLWLADWGQAPRRAVWAWQSGQATVPGISEPVDVGWWYG